MPIFLRPQPAATPVDYVKSVEKSGLIVFPKRQLAIYTCKGAPNVGPVGPQGPAGDDGIDQNSWYDTIIASASDEYSPITVGGPKTNFRAPYPLDLAYPGYLGYIRCSLTTAPVGLPMIIDVKLDGVTMFSTKITIDAGETTSVTAAIPAVLSITDVPDDAEFTVHVDQVGSVVAGSGLKVAVTGIKADASP